MKQLELYPDDDIISVLDRLPVRTSDRILLISEDDDSVEEAFSNPIDLVRLRRVADRHRLQIGLVSTSTQLEAWSREAGLPIFKSSTAASTDERTWRRGRRRGTPIGLQPEEIRAHQTTVLEEKQLAARRRSRRPWEYWVKRYAAVAALFLAAAGLFIAAVYFIPSGEIYLRPVTEPVTIRLDLTAATAIDEAVASAQQVPARLTTVTASWTTAIATTGTASQPDAPGRGQVILTNLTVDSLEIPAGTLVWAETTNGTIEFQTVQPLTLPDVVGATGAVDIVALEPGVSGNVAAESIAFIDETFADKVELRNADPTAGGAIRPVAAVSESDRERLRAQLAQYLQSQAIEQIEIGLSENELLARETLRVRRIISEEWSDAVGQPADSLSLTLTAEITGLVIDTAPAVDLVYNRLTQAVPPGYTLLPDSFSVSPEAVNAIEENGAIAFSIEGRGQVAANIDPETEIERIAGHDVDDAMAYLQETLLLNQRPTAAVFPNWLGRLPYLPGRIEVIVEE